jgi:predicted enzyme related to lactoylglutathione lyase
MAKKKAKAAKSKSKPAKKAAKKASAKKKSSVMKASTPRNKSKSRAARQTQSASSGGGAQASSGSFVWHELMTTDVGAAKRFYSRLFGWDSTDTEMMPGFTYTMFKRNGTEFGGLMAITPEWGDVKPHWLQYVAVPDVDDAAQQAESLGGQVSVPPHDIPVGRFAILKDPAGAVFAVYKSNSAS